MSDSVVQDSLLERARAIAARGEWGGVRLLLAECREVPDSAPALLLLLAESDLRTGFLPEARTLLQLVVPRLAGGADKTSYRRAINMLGAAAFELGLLDEAEQQFQLSLALANGAGDYRTVGHATNNLGMIANIRGEFDKALSLYQLAVPAFQRVGYVVGLGETNHNMALSLREMGALELADKQERRAIAFAREAGNARLLAIAHVGRAELSLRRGEPAVAEAGARLGAEQYAAIPDAIGEADALRVAGAARLVLGEVVQAAKALDRAVALAEEHGSALIEAESRGTRARLFASRQEWDLVRRDVECAAVLYRQLGADRDREALERWLGEVLPH
ncbi:MAG: tetratricopeptide repeat protein [Gemmatimonadota bacterium]|nr:tetratricopeptide repeat protein [Gemmatimonadota bacterium]